MHIDWTPFIPVINDTIKALAGAVASLVAVAVPALLAYGTIWIRNHGIAAKQQAAATVATRITTTVQNGLKYSSTGADDGVRVITIPVADPKIASAANYAALQSPDLLKQGGIDVKTEEGQQALVRRVTAASAPDAPLATPTLDVNLTAEAKT